MTNSDRHFYKILLPCSLLSLALCFLMRWFWVPLHNLWGTYPSDVWYIHNNYGWFLVNYGFFEMEYPSALFCVFKLLSHTCQLLFPCDEPGRYGGTIYSLRAWFIVNGIFLGAGSILSVYGLHRLDCEFFHLPRWRTLWCYVFTPSFIFFTIFNYDMIPILCTIWGLYYFLKKEYISSFVILGMGAAFKVYPILMMLPFLCALPRGKRFNLLIWGLSPLVCFNVPFMIADFKRWLYPYTWQMQFDNGEQIGHVIYHLTVLLGKIPALAIFGLLFLYCCYRIRAHSPEQEELLPRYCALSSLILFLVFTLTKTIFSPQYIFWFSPFLPLVTDYPFWGIGPLIELINICEVLFLDYWRTDRWLGIYIIRSIREVALLALLVYNLRQLNIKE